jgi:hypothetical protein
MTTIFVRIIFITLLNITFTVGSKLPNAKLKRPCCTDYEPSRPIYDGKKEGTLKGEILLEQYSKQDHQ